MAEEKKELLNLEVIWVNQALISVHCICSHLNQ